MTAEKLQQQIDSAQQTVATDQYPMSIGELSSLYRDSELILNPKFQRYYRWSKAQKSALIESILVGIPVPPIFCYEREDSKWEIVDGLQRVSTIFEFMGLLKDPAGKLVTSQPLSKTQYLPALEGALWEHSEPMQEGTYSIATSLQIGFKRAKIGIQIIKRGSGGNTKYDLFQRLNSNGSPLTSQEYRSCILVMINEPLFDRVVAFAADPKFRTVLRLDTDDTDKQDDIDYACRFLTHSAFEYETRDKDVDEFISDSVKQLFLDKTALVAPLIKTGKSVIHKLDALYGADALRRFQDGKPTGRAGRVGFETIVVGLAHNWESISKTGKPDEFIKSKIEALWNQPTVADFTSPGTRGTDRIRKTVPFGKQWFAA